MFNTKEQEYHFSEGPNIIRKKKGLRDTEHEVVVLSKNVGKELDKLSFL